MYMFFRGFCYFDVTTINFKPEELIYEVDSYISPTICAKFLLKLDFNRSVNKEIKYH